MAKGVLEFDLPEEREEFELAQSAGKMARALSEFDNFLRGQLKHNSDNLSDEKYSAYEELRSKLREFVNDEDLTGIF